MRDACYSYMLLLDYYHIPLLTYADATAPLLRYDFSY